MKRCAQTQKVKVGYFTLPEATADCECFLPNGPKSKLPRIYYGRETATVPSLCWFRALSSRLDKDARCATIKKMNLAGPSLYLTN